MVTLKKQWRSVAENFDVKETCTNAATRFRHIYEFHLKQFETCRFKMMNCNKVSVLKKDLLRDSAIKRIDDKELLEAFGEPEKTTEISLEDKVADEKRVVMSTVSQSKDDEESLVESSSSEDSTNRFERSKCDRFLMSCQDSHQHFLDDYAAKFMLDY